jgi:hypothetical protein
MNTQYVYFAAFRNPVTLQKVMIRTRMHRLQHSCSLLHSLDMTAICGDFEKATTIGDSATRG